MSSTYLIAFGGGLLIGLAATILWLGLGRVAGISGIWGLSMSPSHASGGDDRTWRLAFIVGMVAAGIVASMVAPSSVAASPAPMGAMIVAGLLVGFGTRLGSGCTSGHGVCGLARLSPRSLVAVITFIATGAVTVGVVRLAGGWS